MKRLGRVLIALILLLAVGAAWRALVGISDLEQSAEAGQFLLPLLSLALVTLTLALAGVLIRNLVKLIVERKRGILGATLRSKLVFYNLALVLVPAIVLFYGSASVIKLTVEAILRAPLEQLTRGRQIVDEWTDHFRQQTLHRADALADEIVELPRHGSGAIFSLLERDRDRGRYEMARVVRDGRTLAAAYSDGRHPEPLLEELALAALEMDTTRIDEQDRGPFVYAGVARETSAGPTVVIVGTTVPASIWESLASIDAADSSYRQFRTKRRDLVRLYLTLIGLIFVATLFVATWLGFYISRRITGPLQALAAASREISAGNLDVRVDARIGDEMGTLVESFNDMAAELQENRAVITRSTGELRRSNREIEGRRHYIETLLAGLSTGVVSTDTSGSVTAFNPAAIKILDVELRIGATLRPALQRAGLTRLFPLLDELEQHGSMLRRDLELPRPDGPSRTLSLHLSSLEDGSGERLGTLLMVEDLTALLRAQKALAWQEIARRIAHEIKNPLTPIQLAAQRLRKKFSNDSPDLPQVVAESTAAIEREVGGLKQLVDEFSRFARLPEIRPESIALRTVVESVLSLYSGSTMVEWEVEFDDRVREVQLDPQQIRRALINLVDNALAAMEGRGRLQVAVRLDGERVRIEIADDGPGICAADRDRMFVPYFSTKPRGSGLGLAIVHKIVTDHGGTIRAEENEPRGARFVIELPISDAARATARG